MVKKTGKAAPKRAPVKAAAKPKIEAQAGPRWLKWRNYRSPRLEKRTKHPVKLPNVWYLTETAAKTLWENRGLFAGITLVYGLLKVVLAQGLSGGTSVTALKNTLEQGSKGHMNALASGLNVFTSLVGSVGNSSSSTGAAYQLPLAFIASLAVIWALRQVLAGSVGVRIRDAYYRGMYPLVPFILVLVVVGLQLVPLLVGSTVYALVINNGIAIFFIEKLALALLYGLLALLSFYLISSSLFALYIVTLPDMTPMKALRSARELVRYRRWTVLRKILYLPILLLAVAAIIMLPIIAWLAPLAQWVFFLLIIFGLTAVHAYMYTLYRELLND